MALAFPFTAPVVTTVPTRRQAKRLARAARRAYLRRLRTLNIQDWRDA